MKKWEKLAQEAMLEPDPEKAWKLYNESRKEAIKDGAFKGLIDEPVFGTSDTIIEEV